MSSSDSTAFLHRLAREAAPLRASGGGVLIACSGGPDSTALLHALHALAPRRAHGWRLEVAHLHHGLRGADADADAAFVADLAHRLGIPYHERRADVSAIAAAEKISLEDAGRRARYAFFEEVARARSLSRVATAHHADDQAETILARILRGSGVRGLSGIPSRRPIAEGSATLVVRPFLSFSRDEVRAYLAAIGERARVDASNASLDHFRNTLRLEVLPFLRARAPGVDAALARLSASAGEVGAWLEDESSRRLDAAGVGASLPSRLPLTLFSEAPPPLRRWLSLRAIERSAGTTITAERAGEIASLAEPGRETGSLIELGHGLRARRERNAIVLERAG